MRPSVTLPSLCLLAVTACAPGAATPVATAPLPVPAAPPAVSRDSAPADWQFLDLATDGILGTSMRRAERELLAGRRPQRTVLVAVIDGGVDTAHADLRPQLWRNPRETANGRDDDGNGLVDDVHGWNWIGGPGGRSVARAPYELTRQQVRCTAAAPADSAGRARCATVAAAYAKRLATAQQERAIMDVAMKELGMARRALGTKALTPAQVTQWAPTVDSLKQARQVLVALAAGGIALGDLDALDEASRGTLEQSLNLRFDPRAEIVRDDPARLDERTYGNGDITGPDAGHGSHVAGIIGAARDGQGIDGMATAVRLMGVRAIPNGDEWDKDVANAIRYAVDQGAQIVNMSFGKALSPDKPAVDAAVRYAESRGVLIVHAAGNDGVDLRRTDNFPTPRDGAGRTFANWIEVGASSWKGGRLVAAPFSNYGASVVDVLAPGVDILSTVPGGGYARKSGTSMATPVVSGVAAMLMSYFPTLSAVEVRRILLESAVRFPGLQVVRPGTPDVMTPFDDLSATAGVVNAYEAVRAALRVAP
jgi:subtilisin family serine protease